MPPSQGDFVSHSFYRGSAVADYGQCPGQPHKIKKTSSEFVLTLERTPDILSEVSAARHDHLLVIGFAAETENIIEHAREKLLTKKLDVIVANDVTRSDAASNATTNAITIHH